MRRLSRFWARFSVPEMGRAASSSYPSYDKSRKWPEAAEGGEASWIAEQWAGLRVLFLVGSIAVLLYSVMVLAHVAYMGTIGVRCMFGTIVEEQVPRDFVWERSGVRVEPPQVGDVLSSIDGTDFREGDYSAYLKALRGLSDRIGESVDVRWVDVRTGEPREASAVVRYAPTRSYVWSCVWFLQELVDLRRGRAGVLEASQRRVGPAVLLALHRHGRGVHGGVSLDGDRAPALADLSVRAVRGVGADGQPALLSGLPPAEPDSTGPPPLGSRDPLRRARRRFWRPCGGPCSRRDGSATATRPRARRPSN